MTYLHVWNFKDDIWQNDSSSLHSLSKRPFHTMATYLSVIKIILVIYINDPHEKVIQYVQYET